MRQHCLLLAILLLPLLTVSCGGDNPPTSQREQPAVAPIRASASSGAPVAAPTSNTPVPPKDARYTILCTVISGADHVAQANEVKNVLLRSTKPAGWYVVHDEGRSIVYYGYYR